NSLPDPPGGVGAEASATSVVKFVNGRQQADVTFLDKVKEVQTLPEITFGNTYDEARVRTHKKRSCCLPLIDQALQFNLRLLVDIIADQLLRGIAAQFYLFRQLYFFVGSQEALAISLQHIAAEKIAGRHFIKRTSALLGYFL